MTVSQRHTIDDRGAAPYAGRRIALATMHGKEEAIAPPFGTRLHAEVTVAPGLDTDALGTFSGEIERQGTMGEVALAKARLGMAATGLELGLASEGTYGPHPVIPFIAGGMELLVLVDDERGFTVSESLIDDAPCFNHAFTSPDDDIAPFLARVGFPRHALIVRPSEPVGSAPIAKGIRDRASLTRAMAAAAEASRDGRALIQTDMRAHMNPTRMTTLGRLARRLCDRLMSPCPSCAAPGFGVVELEKGLPCEWCNTPSRLVRREVFGCARCEHRERRPRADGLTHADPGQCAACNP